MERKPQYFYTTIASACTHSTELFCVAQRLLYHSPRELVSVIIAACCDQLANYLADKTGCELHTVDACRECIFGTSLADYMATFLLVELRMWIRTL